MANQKLITVFFISKKDAFQGFLTTHLQNNAGIKIKKLLTPDEDFDLTEAEQCDIIIVDIEDKDFHFDVEGKDFHFDDLEILQTIIELYPNKKVIGITDNFNDELAAKVISMGAKGYFFRDAPDLFTISDCIKLVQQGEICINTSNEKGNNNKA